MEREKKICSSRNTIDVSFIKFFLQYLPLRSDKCFPSFSLSIASLKSFFMQSAVLSFLLLLLLLPSPSIVPYPYTCCKKYLISFLFCSSLFVLFRFCINTLHTHTYTGINMKHSGPPGNALGRRNKTTTKYVAKCRRRRWRTKNDYVLLCQWETHFVGKRQKPSTNSCDAPIPVRRCLWYNAAHAPYFIARDRTDSERVRRVKMED